MVVNGRRASVDGGWQLEVERGAGRGKEANEQVGSSGGWACLGWLFS